MACRVKRLIHPAAILAPTDAGLGQVIVGMLPVAVALAGCRLSTATVAFMGWFGPRGLASIVLGLVYLEQHAHLPGRQATTAAGMATVLLSVLGHCLSAMPVISLTSLRKASKAP